MGRKLDLTNPKTLNEKIMWLKLNTYRDNPLVIQCADKYRVREYLASQGLSHIQIPLYYVYDNAESINWLDLPGSFVIKCNHGCGYNIICTDKAGLNIRDTEKQLRIWTKSEYWRRLAEINYRHIPHKIICEKYLSVENGSPPEDYKVYCFNGQARYVLVCVGRFAEKTFFYFFDEKWELARINPDGIAAYDGFSLPEPAQLPNMLNCSAILSRPFPFVRIDYYVVNNDLYFGEMTFTPSAGLDKNRLPETDLLFGSMIDLNYASGVADDEDGVFDQPQEQRRKKGAFARSNRAYPK